MGRDRNQSSRRRGSSTSLQGADEEAIPASGVLDLFTDVDDLLREVNDTLSGLSANQAALGNVLQDVANTDVDLPSRTDRPLVSDAVVAQGEEESESVTVPKDGRLTKVYLSFPSGANQSLGIGVRGVDDESLVPYGPKDHKYIAFSGTVVPFDLNYRVEKGEKLTVEYVNNRPETNDDDGYLSVVLVVTEDQ